MHQIVQCVSHDTATPFASACNPHRHPFGALDDGADVADDDDGDDDEDDEDGR